MPPTSPVTDSESIEPNLVPASSIPAMPVTNLYDPAVFQSKIPFHDLEMIFASHPTLRKEHVSNLPYYIAMAHDEYKNMIAALESNFNLPQLELDSGTSSQPPTFLALRRFLIKTNAANFLGLIRQPYKTHEHEIKLNDLPPQCYDIFGYLQKTLSVDPSVQKSYNMLYQYLMRQALFFELAIQAYRHQKLRTFLVNQKKAVLHRSKQGTHTSSPKPTNLTPLTPAELKQPTPRKLQRLELVLPVTATPSPLQAKKIKELPSQEDRSNPTASKSHWGYIHMPSPTSPFTLLSPSS